MSVSNIIASNNKIYDDLLPNPYPYPAFPNGLAPVLLVNNNAGNQNIENLLQLETTNVVQQNQIGGHLTIGGTSLSPGSGGDLRIQGGTNKGSLLVGNGTSTVELPAGSNGLVLTTNSATLTGLEWAVGGGGGGVASVSGGNNINILGTPTNPIVELATQVVLADLTDTTSYSPTGISKSVGATTLSISSTTGEIDITPLAGSNLDLNVNGAGKLHIVQGGSGGVSQPAISIENNNGNANEVHVDIYKNSNSPAVNDRIGAIGFHGNSSTGVKTNYVELSTTINDPTNTSQNGSLSISACNNSATPTEFLRCNGSTGKNQLYKDLDTLTSALTTSTGTLQITQPNNSGSLNITTSGSSCNLNISASGATSSIGLTATQNINVGAGGINLNPSNISLGVSVGTPSLGRTNLRTTIVPTYSNQPVDFVPEVSIDNNNLNSVPINLPQVSYQKLHLLNKGILPLSGWQDEGNSNGFVDGMLLDSSNFYVWLGISSTVIITDVNFSNIYQTINLGGGANIRAYTFYEYGGYMFIGGIFDSVNGNATPQYGLTRIYLGGGVGFYTEDPIFDSINNIFGVLSGQAVLTIGEQGGNILVGGTFNNFSNGTTANYGFQVQNPTGTSGSQTYDDNSGSYHFNGPVYSIKTAGSYAFWGGNFTTATGGIQPLNYIGAYNAGWTQVALNAFDNSVYSISVSQVIGNQILVGGTFNQNSVGNVCYVDYTAPFNQETSAGITASNVILVGGNGGLDLFTTTSGDNYISSSSYTWSSLGQSNSGVQPSGIFVYNGQAYNSYNSYSYVRRTFTASQAVSFILPAPNIFRYNGGEYQTFTLSAKWTAQSFMTDSTASYWFPLGAIANGGSFS